ncbi:MAG: transcription repressor NadR [Lachnospiraceae bacterium]|nr:transcription repressor NadR [Lachnospiraceae bacterium]
MDGSERREAIKNIISCSEKPVSGKALAEHFNVSRQVIVQDIALLRAKDFEVYSTNRGYVTAKSSNTVPVRIFKVNHTDEQIEDELNLMVDLGGNVRDVFINHKVYGEIRASLECSSRRNVKEFMEGIRSGKSSPLKNITSGYHYHTVEADSEETLDLIEEELRKHHYLVEKKQ